MSRSCSFSFVVLIAASLLGVPGCAGIAWFVAQFAPPQKTKALYTIPRGTKVLVFADDPAGALQDVSIKAELTKRLNEQIGANKIADETVPYQKLLDVLTSTPQFGLLSVSEIGKLCGADVVLYVQIDRFQLKDDRASPLWQGKFETTVKVVDVEAGRLWPKDRPDGYPIDLVETPISAESAHSYRLKLTRQLADLMADRIAKCFYEYEMTRDPEWSWEQ